MYQQRDLCKGKIGDWAKLLVPGWRDMLMGSPLYKEWVEEERKEAAEESRIATLKNNTRDKINEVLELKFDFVAKDIRTSIENIEDINALDGLFSKSLSVSNIEEFEALLKKAKDLN